MTPYPCEAPAASFTGALHHAMSVYQEQAPVRLVCRTSHAEQSVRFRAVPQGGRIQRDEEVILTLSAAQLRVLEGLNDDLAGWEAYVDTLIGSERRP